MYTWTFSRQPGTQCMGSTSQSDFQPRDRPKPLDTWPWRKARQIHLTILSSSTGREWIHVYLNVAGVKPLEYHIPAFPTMARQRWSSTSKLFPKGAPVQEDGVCSDLRTSSTLGYDRASDTKLARDIQPTHSDEHGGAQRVETTKDHPLQGPAGQNTYLLRKNPSIGVRFGFETVSNWDNTPTRVSFRHQKNP